MVRIGDAVALLLGGNLVVEIILLAAKVGHHRLDVLNLPVSFLEPKALKP